MFWEEGSEGMISEWRHSDEGSEVVLWGKTSLQTLCSAGGKIASQHKMFKGKESNEEESRVAKMMCGDASVA